MIDYAAVMGPSILEGTLMGGSEGEWGKERVREWEDVPRGAWRNSLLL